VLAEDVALVAASVRAPPLSGVKKPEKAGDAKPVEPSAELVAFSTKDGKELWRCDLPVPAVYGGLLVDRNGLVIVVLENGAVLCLDGARE
jgi:outer membrane protein assembly factor BamB